MTYAACFRDVEAATRARDTTEVKFTGQSLGTQIPTKQAGTPCDLHICRALAYRKRLVQRNYAKIVCNL